MCYGHTDRGRLRHVRPVSLRGQVGLGLKEGLCLKDGQCSLEQALVQAQCSGSGSGSALVLDS